MGETSHDKRVSAGAHATFWQRILIIVMALGKVILTGGYGLGYNIEMYLVAYWPGGTIR